MEPETASGPRAACVSLHFQSLSFQSLDGINVLCQLLLLHRARAALTTHRSKGARVGLHSQSLFSPALNITIASWQLLQPNLDNGLTRRHETAAWESATSQPTSPKHLLSISR
jgi:hypothetical protein